MSSAVLVCNENGKDDALAEDEEGWHEGIRVENDGRTYYGYNTLVTTGYFEHFKWEKGIGLVEYWSGYGAFADGIELYLEEMSSEGAPSEKTESETGKNDIKAWEENILMADSEDVIGGIDENAPVLGSDIARKDIVTVTFLDTLDDMLDNAWDVSQDKNKKVMAWTNEADGGYNLFIGAEGGVAANENSDHLFCMYVNLKKINFNNNLHTENAVSMSGMFSGCGNLTELNLKAFDTSNVTRMAAMFYGCANINVLDVSNFDTSNVMYMDFMFYGCESLTELDVNGFDTSSLTDASYMFYGCTSLPAPNVSNFDQSIIETMEIGGHD